MRQFGQQKFMYVIQFLKKIHQCLLRNFDFKKKRMECYINLLYFENTPYKISTTKNYPKSV